MKTRLVVLIAAVAVAAAGYLWWVSSRPAPMPEPVAPPAEIAPPEEQAPETVDPAPMEDTAPETAPDPDPVLDPAPDAAPEDAAPEPELGDPALDPAPEAAPDSTFDSGAPGADPVQPGDMQDDGAVVEEGDPLEPENFDAARLRALVEEANLSELERAQLNALIDSADQDPTLIDQALDALRDQLAP